MSIPPPVLQHMIRKFQRRASLNDDDVQALLELPYRLTTTEAARYIVREGSSPEHSVIILSGLAYRHKLTAEGARQIVSIHIPGDFVDLEGTLLNVADHNVQALTRCELALVPSRAIVQLIDSHPRVARAMWVDTLIDGSIFREWVMNIGRRDARERLAPVLRICAPARGLRNGLDRRL
jgi:CRP-like cAMP-binding protein